MPGQRPTLRRLRPWVSLGAAVLVGMVACERVMDIEPHLESSVFLDFDSPENQSWDIRLVARGGGAVRDVSVTTDHPRAEVMNARVASLESNATLATRVRISPRPEGAVTVLVRYASDSGRREIRLTMEQHR